MGHKQGFDLAVPVMGLHPLIKIWNDEHTMRISLSRKTLRYAYMYVGLKEDHFGTFNKEFLLLLTPYEAFSVE